MLCLLKHIFVNGKPKIFVGHAENLCIRPPQMIELGMDIGLNLQTDLLAW